MTFDSIWLLLKIPKLLQPKYLKTENWTSASGHESVTVTGFILPTQTTKKVDKLYEITVVIHWKTGSTGQRSSRKGKQMK